MDAFKKVVRKTEANFDRVKFKVKDKLGLFDPVFIYPYRGFGNGKDAYLHGRVLEKEAIIHSEEFKNADTLWENLRKVWKRYESDEVPGVAVEGKMMGVQATTISDREGYFTLCFEGLPQDQITAGWHDVALRIAHMPFDLDFEEEARGEVLLPSGEADFGIISDVDDTIIESNAMHTWKKFTTMMRKDAHGRVPFDGVDELYESLIQANRNPLIFVSGSSYNLYDMLVAFCEQNGIPKAPFFLRDLGLDARQWIKQDTHSYKTDHIERIFEIYPKLSFILIGDSGQEDPEIYQHIHQQHPGRVKAIYIRHVHHERRQQAIQKMADESDIPFLLISHSQEALDHARKEGYLE